MYILYHTDARKVYVDFLQIFGFFYDFKHCITLPQVSVPCSLPFRNGRRNDSAYIPETAAVIAAVRGTTPEELGRQTAANARTLFGI